MATLLSFDNINRLTEEDRKRHFEEYFRPMYLTEEQKKKRAALADDIMDAVLFLFTLYLVALQNNREIERARAEREYREQLLDAMKNYDIDQEIVNRYLDEIAAEEVRATSERASDDEYWTSPERALTISEDDSNILWDNQEYSDAVAAGMTSKQWHTMEDDRVRPTHVDVNLDVVPIDEPFVVGNSLMMFPHDSSLGADISEIANCRCSVSYE